MNNIVFKKGPIIPLTRELIEEVEEMRQDQEAYWTAYNAPFLRWKDKK